ncbi:hypothetical protein FBU30_005401 [Linnemannia zychae]|nr:hypothetical protein FBU30_005401 [Linnemannia zychae]
MLPSTSTTWTPPTSSTTTTPTWPTTTTTTTTWWTTTTAPTWPTTTTTTNPRTTTTKNPRTTTDPIKPTIPTTSSSGIATTFTSQIYSPPNSVISTSTDLSVIPTSTKGPGNGNGGLPKVAVIGIAAAGVIIIGFVSVVLVMKNQRHKKQQKELDPNELFGHFHNPPSPSPLTHITSGHHHNKHHQHLNDDHYPQDDGYDHGGDHHEMEKLYNNSDYHHNHNHHDGHHHHHHDGHHHGDYNGYDHHYDTGGGQGQSGQGIGGDGVQSQGQGFGDSGGHFDYGQGQGQGQSMGGGEHGHYPYDNYGNGVESGYNHGQDYGFGQGGGDLASPYGNGVTGGTGGGFSGGGNSGVGVQSITPINPGFQSVYPVATSAIPPSVPFITKNTSSNRISVDPTNTTAQTEYALLDLTSVPAQNSVTTNYRPLDRFFSNASQSTRHSGAGGSSPVPPLIPARPDSSVVTHMTWDDTTQEYRPDRPLSQTSLASSAGPYQSLGSPVIYQDFIPPSTTKSPPPLPTTTTAPVSVITNVAGTRRSVGAPQDRGPDILVSPVSTGQVSDLNAFERRAPQTQQESSQNPDSLFNVVASTLRQPQGEGGL